MPFVRSSANSPTRRSAPHCNRWSPSSSQTRRPCRTGAKRFAPDGVRLKTDAADYADFLPTGADDRLDELVIRVFVAAREQLGQRLPAIRAVVVRSAEVERAHRIVLRVNREHARQTYGGKLQRIADR